MFCSCPNAQDPIIRRIYRQELCAHGPSTRNKNNANPTLSRYGTSVSIGVFQNTR